MMEKLEINEATEIPAEVVQQSDTVDEAVPKEDTAPRPADEGSEETEEGCGEEALEEGEPTVPRAEENEEKGRSYMSMRAEMSELLSLFPELDVSTVPDSVWQDAENGIPLAAAYALYEKREQRRKQSAFAANEKNRDRATGSVGKGGGECFFSPDEVRAMSRDEVRKNYSIIIESMKKWS